MDLRQEVSGKILLEAFHHDLTTTIDMHLVARFDGPHVQSLIIRYELESFL